MPLFKEKPILKGGCGHFESYSEKFYLVHVICRKVFIFDCSRTKSRGRLPCLKFDPLGSTPEHLSSGNPVTPVETRHPPQGNPSTLLADQGQLPADNLGGRQCGESNTGQAGQGAELTGGWNEHFNISVRKIE